MTLDLAVVEHGSPDRRLPAGAVFAETNLCGGRCYYADGALVAVVDGDYPLRLEYDLEARACRAQLSRRFRADPQAVIGRVVRPLLQSFLLPFVRLKPLHAAALARAGRASCSPAPPPRQDDRGDSARARRLPLLSDDGPLVTTHARAGAAVVARLRAPSTARWRCFRTSRAGRGRTRSPAEVRGRAGAFPYRRRLAPPVRLPPASNCTGAPTAQPSLVALDRAAAFAGLVRDGMIVFRRHVFRQPRFAGYSAWTLECLAAVAAGARAFRLDYADRHLPQLPQLLEALLE